MTTDGLWLAGKFLRGWVRLCGMLIALVGGAHLAAWLLGLMEHRGATALTMKTNAALCLLLSGTSLLLLTPSPTGALRRWHGRFCAGLSLVIAALTLCENVGGWDLGIDQLLASEPQGALGVASPNRMGVPAATSFALAGAALLLLGRRQRQSGRVVQGLALAICLIAILSTVGFLYDAQELYAVTRLTAIAWPTTAAILLLGIALLCACPEDGVTAQVLAADAGGSTLRRLLVPALLVPVILGWLYLTGERWGLYRPTMGAALLIVSFMVIFSSLVYHAGRGVSRSAAALRQSEERFRQLAEGVREAFWVFNVPSRTLEYVSPAVERITGRTREEVGASLDQLQKIFHPDDRAAALSKLELAMQGEPYQVEYRVVRPDGTIRWVRGRGTPLRDRTGNVFRIAGVSEDITDQKDAEEQLRSHQAELAHVSRLSIVGEMAAELAHEVNQPLHAIKNYAAGAIRRLLKSPEADEGLRSALEHISAEASRMAEIVRRIVRFVQKRELQHAEVCLNRVVEDAVVLSRTDLEHRQVKVVLELADALPTIQGDPIQLEQVVVNLVRNAAEAMDETPQGDRKLQVCTTRVGSLVRVDLRDQGRGIPDADAERIFEPFFTTKPEGMGMGLAISRSIVKMHGGCLWVPPNPGGGCTFHVELPIRERS